MVNQSSLLTPASTAKLLFLPFILLKLHLMSTGMPVANCAEPVVTAVESSCVSADGPTTAFSYPCIRRAVFNAMHDELLKMCAFRDAEFNHLYPSTSIAPNLDTSDSITAAQSNFTLLYHLLNMEHANTPIYRGHLNAITSNLTLQNVPLMNLVSECQLSMPSINKTIQAALEDHYTEYGVCHLTSEDGSKLCTTYFNCDVKRLSCDLFQAVQDWYVNDHGKNSPCPASN